MLWVTYIFPFRRFASPIHPYGRALRALSLSPSFCPYLSISTSISLRSSTSQPLVRLSLSTGRAATCISTSWLAVGFPFLNLRPEWPPAPAGDIELYTRFPSPILPTRSTHTATCSVRGASASALRSPRCTFSRTLADLSPLRSRKCYT